MTQQGLDNRPELLAVRDFVAFYEELYGKTPFDWQRRLAERACLGQWPAYIKLPTSSGKTAAIDIAIFALAYQAAEENRPGRVLTAARRIFFVVDRRIIVNEAYRRAHACAEKLHDAIQNAAVGQTLHRVARWLHKIAGGGTVPPLDCFELRGGLYRDDAWVRSPLQPTVLTSTVDQVGSRLLFRGYGVSDRNLPIHAAMTANDSLIVLDEAHCSKPFSQTMDAIKRYRGERWAESPIQTPFSFVQMTATPPSDVSNQGVFALDKSDYEINSLLQERHGCEKPVQLVHANTAKGASQVDKLAKSLVQEAESLAADYALRRIAIVVNRVAVARKAFELLSKKHAENVTLMIGRMRPIDRDRLTEYVQANFGSDQRTRHEHPRFIVATQCLEVGADLDFDGMVSQCASLDALRQRFGRLNRLGRSESDWDVVARGVIVAAEGDLQPSDKLDDDKPLDPIYGNALTRTWHWLSRDAGDGEIVDFGIQAMDAKCAEAGDELDGLIAPAADAPVLMPAHVDMLCQTAPRPTPEPDVALYLHGPAPVVKEVRVCWRADLDMESADLAKRDKNWLDAITICPPTSAECLTVPLPVFRSWLRGLSFSDMTGDVLGEHADGSEDADGKQDRTGPSRRALIWRGVERSKIPRHAWTCSRDEDQSPRSFCFGASDRIANKVLANSTIVLPAEFGGWSSFGYVPGAPSDPAEPRNAPDEEGDDEEGNQEQLSANSLARIDEADRAYRQSRAKSILRVHPKLVPDAKTKEQFSKLLGDATNEDADVRVGQIREWAANALALAGEGDDGSSSSDDNNWLRRLNEIINAYGGFRIFRYPKGLALISSKRVDTRRGISTLPLDTFGDDDDSLSLLATARVPLRQHLADVLAETQRFAAALDLDEMLSETLLASAKYHDIGKADVRFQAMLLGEPVSVAYMQPKLWAKSAAFVQRPRNELPDQFRHEMLSLKLLDNFDVNLSRESDLFSHLVAAHHGHARPFAPVCIDMEPPEVNLALLGVNISISAEERGLWQPACHALDSGFADRFWSLTRKYGWWGIAYLESLLRLADWFASANPGGGDETKLAFSPEPNRLPRIVTKQATDPLVLSGLDGSNPLAFLATLGLFRVIVQDSPADAFRIGWIKDQGAWRPAIVSSRGEKLTEELLLDLLGRSLQHDPEKHPALRLAELLDAAKSLGEVFAAAAANSGIDNRSDADWLSCNGSDISGSENISQLQTTRRDYHAINIRGLVSETTSDHLRRSLFEPWDYSDPIAGVSLHLEPREDRRHAYQWHMPSGDPTRKSIGGMMGANRLALEAWPLFQSLPFSEKLITVGFRGTKANNTQFSWPIWSSSITLAVLRSVLSLSALQQKDLSDEQLVPRGIEVVFRCSRILVGKTPNLTSPIAVST